MNYEHIECIDSTTEFCPCHLAEQNECILCSQLNGKCFCDCKNWKGVCIFQEFINNNSKAKEGRRTYDVLIKEKSVLEENLIKLVLSSPHKLVMDLIKPGAFIFVKGDSKENYFDFPISISDANPDENTLTIYVEIRGVKTKTLLNISENDILKIRAPYFNGIFGIKNLNSTKNEKALILSRGIGTAPAMPILKHLADNNNEILFVNDNSPFKQNYFIAELNKYNLTLKDFNLIDKGELSIEAKEEIKDALTKGISLIYCAGADILIYKTIQYLDELDRKDIKLVCCNNAKMCCGEGVCGSCTARFAGHNVKRLCKVQADPRSIFEKRRLI